MNSTEVPKRESKTFINVVPKFDVIANFRDLQKKIRQLHQPVGYQADEEPRGVSTTVSPCSSSKPSNPMAPTLSYDEQGTPRTPPPRVLCLWDIDDTLVSSGDFGVRQNLMFPEHDLHRLFKTIPNTTRHLLLSQGSVDDVLMEPGRLAFLKNYFVSGKFSDWSSDDEADESYGLFDCCSSSVKSRGRDISLGGSTQAIHLTRIDSCRKELSCSDWRTLDPKDRENNGVRWLILRPGMWGISLARLSSLIPPSSHTAFVDGKHFKKLDIAWSLAASGNWDKVFFMDNNLCEVGIIQYGMSYSTAASTLERRRADKVFLADFTLLRASSKLHVMEKERGIRITYPEEHQDENVSPFNPTPGEFPEVPDIQVVELQVANIHFDLLDYYRVSHQTDRGESEMLAMLSRQCGHPTFFEDKSCTDEQYIEFIRAFHQAEDTIDQIIMEDLRLYGTVGNGWKRGWAPNSSKVILPICTSKLELHIIQKVCVPMYRDFIWSVCANLTLAHKAKGGYRRAEHLSAARKEAFAIYSRIWRECPIIDPAFAVDFALSLYQLHFSEELPPKRKISVMRKKAVEYVTLHDPCASVQFMN